MGDFDFKEHSGREETPTDLPKQGAADSSLKSVSLVHPKFPLGTVTMTPGAALNVTLEEMKLALFRHVRGDWGDLDEHDVRENEISLQQGFRLLSAYKAANGARFWIITEADRSVTTLLLPEEY